MIPKNDMPAKNDDEFALLSVIAYTISIGKPSLAFRPFNNHKKCP